MKIRRMWGSNHNPHLDKSLNSLLLCASISFVGVWTRVKNVDVLVQWCGLPLIICLAVIGLVLTGMALYLACSVRQIAMLVAFFPLTLLPIMIATVPTLMGTLSSIRVHSNPDLEVASEPGFMILVSMVPLLAGLTVATPPALITILGRWVLAWKASGLRLIPDRTDEPSEVESEENWKKQEADDYLRDLVRPR